MKCKNQLKIKVLLLIVMLLQLARIIYVFQIEKAGSHSDESWSFGLANSYYKPHIFMDEEWNETYKDEWISGQTLKDYITVDSNHRFSYDSVIYNLRNDAHPPLYFLILHTICSFFPGEYSRWFSFIINVIVFVPLQIALFFLAKKILKNDYAALGVVFFYGFCYAGVNTFVFTRQYALLTLFSVLFALIHVNLAEAENEKRFHIYLGLLALICILGEMTHYFFLPFAFGLAVAFCFGYLYKKKYKCLFQYAASMLISVLISFPFSNVMSFFGGGSSVETQSDVLLSVEAGIGDTIKSFVGIIKSIIGVLYDVRFEKRANIVLSDLIYDLFGLKIELNFSYIFYYVFIYAFFLFLFWAFLSFIIVRIPGQKENDILLKVARKTGNLIDGISKERFIVGSLISAVLMELWFVIGFARPEIMEEETDRYFFLTYPIFAIIIYSVVRKLVSLLGQKVKMKMDNLALIIVLILCITNSFLGSCIYLYERPHNVTKFEQLSKGNDVVLVNSLHWLTTCYTTLLFDAQDVYLTTTESNPSEHAKDLKKADTDKLLILVDVSKIRSLYALGHDISREEVTRKEAESKYLDDFCKIYSDRDIEYLYEDVIFGREVYVYMAQR